MPIGKPKEEVIILLNNTGKKSNSYPCFVENAFLNMCFF